NRQLVHIVGVTPPEFFGLVVGESFDIIQPMCGSKEPLRSDVFDITVMGRLKPGWSLARASAELKTVSPAVFAATFPAGYSERSLESYRRFQMAAHSAAAGVSS